MCQALGPLSAIDATRVVFVDSTYDASVSDLDGVEGVAGSPLAGTYTHLTLPTTVRVEGPVVAESDENQVN